MFEAAKLKLYLKSSKLYLCHIGPFKIAKHIDNLASQVNFSTVSKLNTDFHVSQIRNSSGDSPSPKELIGSSNPGKASYKVEFIMAKRLSRGRRSYLVK